MNTLFNLSLFNSSQAQTKSQLIYKGRDISQDSIAERSERIGFVLQNPNQMISQTMIFDEVALGLRLRGIEETEVEGSERSAMLS